MNDSRVLKAALFDFDGVVMDTEGQYTCFWNEKGMEYLGRENFGFEIKGMTLRGIFAKELADRPELYPVINRDLEEFESGMKYEYVPGVLEFIDALRGRGIKTAIVTSSLDKKMQNIYRVRTELTGYFDIILTAEDFSRSKPDPECYLRAMERLGVSSRESVVFEDSFSGLRSGRDSRAFLVALSTTNSAEVLRDKADYVIPDFREMTPERLEKIMLAQG